LHQFLRHYACTITPDPSKSPHSSRAALDDGRLHLLVGRGHYAQRKLRNGEHRRQTHAEAKRVARANGGAAASGLAADLARGVTRLFAELDIAALAELSLATGRRVDVIGIGRDGQVHVVEIKSSRADFRADRKWQDYLGFADFFYFAVAADFPRDLLPAAEGLILADRFGAEIARPAAHRPLPAARRKALTLRFARTAASRLMLPVIGDGGSLPAQLE
jgi:hypothetical protein